LVVTAVVFSIGFLWHYLLANKTVNIATIVTFFIAESVLYAFFYCNSKIKTDFYSLIDFSTDVNYFVSKMSFAVVCFLIFSAKRFGTEFCRFLTIV
jgi:hypothetical protein